MPFKRKKGTRTEWILTEEKFLSPHEIRKLMRVSKKGKDRALVNNCKTPVKDWFLIDVAAETGLRVQEMADLSCGDLQINGFMKAVIVRNGKGGKPRLVRVSERFSKNAADFLEWKSQQGDSIVDDAPVFSVNGRHMSSRALQKSYHRSLARAGIAKTAGHGIHVLRHTYACFLLKASKSNLRLVQKALGHSSIRTTQIYADVFDEDMTRAVERLYA